MSPALTVVVSTLGNYAGLARVLDHLERQRCQSDGFEVLVVVDAADPDPDAVAGAIGSRSFPLRQLTGSRPGLSANRNKGWRSAAAPIVLFTDNDTLGAPDLIAQHLAWHLRHPAPEVGVLGLVKWSREVRITPFMRWLDQGIQFDYPNIEGINAGWGRFYGANASVKVELLTKVGGFDEDRLPYGYEDIEWSYRASKLGFRLLYNEHAVVEHLRTMDLEFWRKRVRRIAASERELVRMHPEIEPYFFGLFSRAKQMRPARGRGIRLLGVVPRRTPWLGPRAWTSADHYFRQALADDFLEAWAAAAVRQSGEIRPDVAELRHG